MVSGSRTLVKSKPSLSKISAVLRRMAMNTPFKEVEARHSGKARYEPFRLAGLSSRWLARRRLSMPLLQFHNSKPSAFLVDNKT